MDSFFWRDGFDVLFFLIFAIIIVVLVVGAVRGIEQWDRNNHSPRLSVTTWVTAKHTNMVCRQHANAGDMARVHGFHSSSSASYYITFETASGDRIELSMDGSEYGMLAEGDTGALKFQGTGCLEFERCNS